MILIVDDEPSFSAPLQWALEFAGFETCLAATPSECMGVVAGGKPVDLVILDVMLPAGDFDLKEVDGGMGTGLVLLTKIRDKLANVPVIILSVRTDIAVNETNYPPTVFIPKTELTLEKLVSTVRQFLKSPPAGCGGGADKRSR